METRNMQVQIYRYNAFGDKLKVSSLYYITMQIFAQALSLNKNKEKSLDMGERRS